MSMPSKDIGVILSLGSFGMPAFRGAAWSGRHRGPLAGTGLILVGRRLLGLQVRLQMMLQLLEPAVRLVQRVREARPLAVELVGIRSRPVPLDHLICAIGRADEALELADRVADRGQGAADLLDI